MEDKPITESDKRAIRTMVAMGCEITVAAQALGWNSEQLADELHSNPAFASEVEQAEGQAQFHFVRSLHSASKDEKHWRAATWWLERRAQKQFALRGSRAWTDAELVAFLDSLTTIIVKSVSNLEDRQQLLADLGSLAQGETHTSEGALK
ncbi:hypothetical protein [Bythopirellula goksoeyrii]|uniref:Uncharacterized protein n=1 Tax=Bythopirellula goksoeyrii TaxID=1400387 RepID=A0A5B9QGC3_9BACT|nr:hypothetical protein [Bythopirellula goksoeyrii]QEG37834.1 hypothetical protein Pr1d_51820 [Bythopirellula goksoeyrii]